VTRDWLWSVTLLLAAVVIPLALVTLLVVLDHWTRLELNKLLGPLPWQLNVSLMIVPGLIPIAYLRWGLGWRIAVGFIYFAAMFAILPLYGLVISCSVTGDCI
jgi:hypothetical protein